MSDYNDMTAWVIEKVHASKVELAFWCVFKLPNPETTSRFVTEKTTKYQQRFYERMESLIREAGLQDRWLPKRTSCQNLLIACAFSFEFNDVAMFRMFEQRMTRLTQEFDGVRMQTGISDKVSCHRLWTHDI